MHPCVSLRSTCKCAPSMQGIRCGARLGQRTEIQILKQLSSVVGEGMFSLWRTKLAHTESWIVRYPIDPVQPRKNCSLLLDATHTFHTSSRSTSNPCVLQCSHICRKKIFKRSFPLPPPEHASPGILDRGYHVDSVRQVSFGLGCASRVASAPRQTSFKPDYDWLERRRHEELCPGCGIKMQDADSKAPGFFKEPTKRIEGELEVDEDERKDPNEGGMEWEEWEAASQYHVFDPSVLKEPDPVDDTEETGQKKRSRKGKLSVDPSERPTVCARCHALRNNGRVKDETVENLLPDFDFEHVVGSRLKKSIGRRAVVLMVIDSVDFDGSFPRLVANLMAEAEKDLRTSWQDGKPGNSARLLIVLNKVDLLPGQMSPIRLEQWVRRRSRAGGVTDIGGVHIVSAFKGWGVDKLFKQVTEMAGPRGDVWVIGAQNAGKSSLINALGKVKVPGVEERKKVFLTEAAVPGTTLGVLKLEGVLPGRARLLDTPGLLHPHQITTRLTWEEQKMVQIRKVLKPRTYRVKVGHAISIGGLARVSVRTAPADSLYVTVWASPFITLHMGKAENSVELFEKHIGDKLQPPSTKERVEELGRWVTRRVPVSGDKWNKSSMDVSIAGIGWISIALSGTAVLEVCTYEGVAVTVREALVFDLALVFEKPGFTATKISAKDKN